MGFFLSLLLVSGVASAEPDRPGSKDFSAVSRFPHTYINGYEEREYDYFDFPRASGPNQHVEGHKVRIEYALNKGVEKASPLEIERNYENALKSAGWTIVKSDDRAVVASLSKDGKEAWVRIEANGYGGSVLTAVVKQPLPILVTAGKATVRPAGAPADVKGGSDYPGIPRLPGHRLSDYRESRFDFFEFRMASGPSHRVEGRKLVLHYDLDKGLSVPSALEWRENYKKVLADEGWTMLASGDMLITALLRDKDKETWAQLEYGQGYGNLGVIIVEKGEMKQVVSANTLLEQMNREGHVSFEVHFDTGKDEIKAESQPVVAQMVEMLKASPTLKVEVQGHTDNVGTEKDNQALSERRAKSVMAALVASGIDAGRLTARGYGQSKPVADNGTEGGRALNRRVELYKR
jgi:outer membrane protein OmpA-like peptidoglycan-associated protein